MVSGNKSNYFDFLTQKFDFFRDFDAGNEFFREFDVTRVDFMQLNQKARVNSL